MSKRVVIYAMAVLCLVSGSGCQQLGAFWYFFLQPQTKKITAEYKMPTAPAGSVLVLVDDDQGLVKPPTARLALVDSLARELKAHKVCDKVTTNEEIARMRQAEPKFDQRGAREMGRLAEADVVLLLCTQSFSVEDELEMATTPAKFAVTVRVIDAKAETADQVRLWPGPTERDGRLVEGMVEPQVLRSLKNVREAHEKLAAVLATNIAELFYDREVGQ
jgi:hypothetical protein